MLIMDSHPVVFLGSDVYDLRPLKELGTERNRTIILSRPFSLIAAI
jgi:hypothetical protein